VNVTQLVERCRDLLGEQPQSPTQPVMWTDQELLRHINSAYDSLWVKLSLADENWGIEWFPLSVLAGVQAPIDGNLIAVGFPEDLGQVVYIEEAVDAFNSGREIPPTTIREMWKSKAHFFPFWGTPTRAWMHTATQQGLLFTKTDLPLNLATTRVWFKRRAPRLARFNMTTLTPSVLRLNFLTGVALGKVSLVNGYYRNSRFECTVTPLSAAPIGVSMPIASSAGSHPNVDFTTGVPHGATGATTWEVLPIFPDHHHELLAHLAIYRALTKGGDQGQRAVVGQDVAVLMDQFVQDIENRQVQYPRTVNYEE